MSIEAQHVQDWRRDRRRKQKSVFMAKCWAEDDGVSGARPLNFEGLRGERDPKCSDCKAYGAANCLAKHGVEL